MKELHTTDIKFQFETLIKKVEHQLRGANILNKAKIEVSRIESEFIENGLGYLELDLKVSQELDLTLSFPRDIIVFAFPVKGKLGLSTKFQQEVENISDKGNYGVLAFPFQDWEFQINANSDFRLVLLCVGLRKVHDLFELDIDQKLKPQNISKTYRSEKVISHRKFEPEFVIPVREILEKNINQAYSSIYKKAKVIEILSLHMDKTERKPESENKCPIVNDNLDTEKIKRAEKILVSNMTDPPSIPELAKLIGTNEMKLKNNFKKIYGNTIYGYLLEHRLNSARLIMDQENIQVKDVAYRIGYTNPSHFIAAFKKKFGLTPKNYLQRA